MKKIEWTIYPSKKKVMAATPEAAARRALPSSYSHHWEAHREPNDRWIGDWSTRPIAESQRGRFYLVEIDNG
jgi:hypothetical protein